MLGSAQRLGAAHGPPGPHRHHHGHRVCARRLARADQRDGLHFARVGRPILRPRGAMREIFRRSPAQLREGDVEVRMVPGRDQGDRGERVPERVRVGLRQPKGAV